MKLTQSHTNQMLEVITDDVMLKGLGLLDNRPNENSVRVWKNAKQSLEKILRPIDEWRAQEPLDDSWINIRLRHYAFFDGHIDIAHIAYDFVKKWVVSIIVYDNEEQVMAGSYFGKSQTDNLFVYMQKIFVNDKQGLRMIFHRFNDSFDAQPFDEKYAYFSDAIGLYLELISSTTGYGSTGGDIGKTDTSRS